MPYYLLTLLILTILFWALYQYKIIKFCAICAAVVVTWTISLIAIYLNAIWADPMIVAILMGASLGALADKYSNNFGFVWKYSMVILGLPSVYLLINKELSRALLIIFILLSITFISRPKNKVFDNNKDIFGECC